MAKFPQFFVSTNDFLKYGQKNCRNNLRTGKIIPILAEELNDSKPNFEPFQRTLGFLIIVSSDDAAGFFQHSLFCGIHSFGYDASLRAYTTAGGFGRLQEVTLDPGNRIHPDCRQGISFLPVTP